MISNFVFQTGTRIIFERGLTDGIKDAKKYLRGLNEALIVTDPWLAKSDLLPRLEASLKEAGISYDIFDKVVPNPTDQSIIEAIEYMKHRKPEFLIGFGGGSSMDTAKACAVVATNGGTLYDYFGEDKVKLKPLDVIAIPTTAGSGAEVSQVIALSDTSTGTKAQIAQAAPDVAILDPTLLSGTPRALSTVAGWDALTHSIESFINRKSSPITDAISFKAFELISGNFKSFVNNPDNIDAASAMLIGSCMACMAAGSIGNGNAHGIGRAVQGYYHIPHGDALAVILPHVLAYNAKAVPEKLTLIARILGVDTEGLSLVEAARMAAVEIQGLRNELGLPTSYKGLGMTEESIPEIARFSMDNAGRGLSKDANPLEYTFDDFVKIITAGFKGEAVQPL